jgi:aldehyde:ferredoxin oxidoreductase
MVRQKARSANWMKYYHLRGWTEEGEPHPETLKALELEAEHAEDQN